MQSHPDGNAHLAAIASDSAFYEQVPSSLAHLLQQRLALTPSETATPWQACLRTAGHVCVRMRIVAASPRLACVPYPVRELPREPSAVGICSGDLQWDRGI